MSGDYNWNGGWTGNNFLSGSGNGWTYSGTSDPTKLKIEMPLVNLPPTKLEDGMMYYGDWGLDSTTVPITIPFKEPTKESPKETPMTKHQPGYVVYLRTNRAAHSPFAVLEVKQEGTGDTKRPAILIGGPESEIPNWMICSDESENVDQTWVYAEWCNSEAEHVEAMTKQKNKEAIEKAAKASEEAILVAAKAKADAEAIVENERLKKEAEAEKRLQNELNRQWWDCYGDDVMKGLASVAGILIGGAAILGMMLWG